MDPEAAPLLAGYADELRERTRWAWATWTSGCAQVFGDEYGLVVETARGAGTRVPSGCPSTGRTSIDLPTSRFRESRRFGDADHLDA